MALLDEMAVASPLLLTAVAWLLEYAGPLSVCTRQAGGCTATQCLSECVSLHVGHPAGMCWPVVCAMFKHSWLLFTDGQASRVLGLPSCPNKFACLHISHVGFYASCRVQHTPNPFVHSLYYVHIPALASFTLTAVASPLPLYALADPVDDAGPSPDDAEPY